MTLDDLIVYGADTEQGLQRCLGREDFYLRLVESLKGETGFDRLRDALAADDLDAAFDAAHALKGVLANLALTPLYEPINEITELLRARTQMDYTPLLDQILAEWDRFLAL